MSKPKTKNDAKLVLWLLFGLLLGWVNYAAISFFKEPSRVINYDAMEGFDLSVIVTAPMTHYSYLLLVLLVLFVIDLIYLVAFLRWWFVRKKGSEAKSKNVLVLP